MSIREREEGDRLLRGIKTLGRGEGEVNSATLLVGSRSAIGMKGGKNLGRPVYTRRRGDEGRKAFQKRDPLPGKQKKERPVSWIKVPLTRRLRKGSSRCNGIPTIGITSPGDRKKKRKDGRHW